MDGMVSAGYFPRISFIYQELNERIRKYSCLRCSQAFRHESKIPNWVGLILDQELQSNARVFPVGMGGFGIA